MTAWILIFWLGYDRGPVPYSIEFTTQERCEKAGAAIFERRASMIAPPLGAYVCTPK